jgi:RNA polymerase sigma-70 factor (subfamily 1)
MEHSESSALLRRARDGSASALNDLLDRNAGKLLAFIRLRMGRNLRAHLESHDILNVTMLNAFQHIDQFEGRGDRSLMAWLAPIALNEIRDQAAYHGRQRRDAARVVDLDDGLEGVAAELHSQISCMIFDQQAERLERAIETLSPEHREVILLRKFEEQSFAEIGERLGKSPDACRMLLARAMTALTLEMRKLH